MLPNIWIFDTYSICMIIGVILCLYIFEKYTQKEGFSINERTSYEILAIASIAVGIVSAMLFQFIYDKIKDSSATFTGAMTFYGGLIGGSLTFILVHIFYLKKKYPNSMNKILIIAPVCICIAHGWGRVGCFCAGCCYGKETNSWLGVKFPDLTNKVYPTQLFEFLFLFVLAAILLTLVYKKKFKYTFPVYLLSYGIFRFLIEFIRGDDRGFTFLGLSPSQFISILLIILSIVTYVLIKKKILIKDNE